MEEKEESVVKGKKKKKEPKGCIINRYGERAVEAVTKKKGGGN